MRSYGSPERVEWVKSLPCVCCGGGPCDNSHIRSRSGAGRKGNADRIVPMCGPCHNLYDDAAAFRARYPNVDLAERAAQLDAQWRAA